MTATGRAGASSAMVRGSTRSSREPGELIRFSATMPCSASHVRLCWATWSFLASSAVSISTTPETGAWSCASRPAGTSTSALPQSHSRTRSASTNWAPQVRHPPAPLRLLELERRPVERRARGDQFEAEPHGARDDSGEPAHPQPDTRHRRAPRALGDRVHDALGDRESCIALLPVRGRNATPGGWAAKSPSRCRRTPAGGVVSTTPERSADHSAGVGSHRVSQSTLRSMTWSRAPGSGNRCVAPATTAISCSATSRSAADRLRSSTR